MIIKVLNTIVKVRIQTIQGHPRRFLLNTLIAHFRLSKVLLDQCLEMHSKQRYRICICSVILGELESSKLQLHGRSFLLSF